MPTLREKMKQEMTLRGFSLGTQENYLRAVINFIQNTTGYMATYLFD
jgi:hypothetical protein